MLRSSITLIEGQENTICGHHSYYYLKIFESHQRTCCDPYKIHKKSANKSLRLVSLALAKSLTGRRINIKPGQKFCPTCRNFCGKKTEENVKSGNDKEDPNVEFTPVQIKMQNIEDANKTLEDLGCSSLKLHALPSHSKASYGKRKLEKVNRVLKEKVYRALDDGEVEDFDIAEGNINMDAEMIKKAQDFDAMIMLMKDKVANVNRAKKFKC